MEKRKKEEEALGDEVSYVIASFIKHPLGTSKESPQNNRKHQRI
jgi:hypothetical protein